MTHEELLSKFLAYQRESEQKITELQESNDELSQSNEKLTQNNEELQQQLDWFKRQLFGEKSERRLPVSSSEQLHLGEMLEDETLPPEKETIKGYQRRRRSKDPFEGTPEDSGLRFDENTVPMEVIEVPNPDIEGLKEDEYQVIGKKTTYHLAQRPGSYVVLKYVRETVKLKKDDTLSTPPAPGSVLEKSFADVSFLVALLIEKFRWHLPLYRQHERLLEAGIKLSRATLTNLVHRTIALLEPIYFAQLSSILQSEVLLMDETPIKAGRKSKGKMKTGYFWPILGDQEEIAFPFAASRAEKVVREALGSFCGTLLTDGYKVYDKYCKSLSTVTHAQCWVHARRMFVKAEGAEAKLAGEALRQIAEIYKVEAQIKEQELSGDKKLAYRQQHTAPIVSDFFKWLNAVFAKQVLLPSNPFTKAANYALEREEPLSVFLKDPNLSPDTNEIERALRPIPLGRKNWMFCWTEVGARYAGIIQSLIQSCRMQGVDPYTYLVDVLQRIETHPAREVHLLTPRLWKENFSDSPIHSDLIRNS